VDPDRMVEAGGGHRGAGRRFRVRPPQHVEQQVVAGVGEQGGVQERVVADRARKIGISTGILKM
jgi:hypothetical protein